MTFKVGDKVRIKASVTNDQLDDIDYPLSLREGVFTVGYSDDNSVRLGNTWWIEPEFIEVIEA